MLHWCMFIDVEKTVHSDGVCKEQCCRNQINGKDLRLALSMWFKYLDRCSKMISCVRYINSQFVTWMYETCFCLGRKCARQQQQLAAWACCSPHVWGGPSILNVWHLNLGVYANWQRNLWTSLLWRHFSSVLSTWGHTVYRPFQTHPCITLHWREGGEGGGVAGGNIHCGRCELDL